MSGIHVSAYIMDSRPRMHSSGMTQGSDYKTCRILNLKFVDIYSSQKVIFQNP